VLAARGIATQGERDETAIVSPADACGVALEFVASR
jgi:hypothetical protein